MKKNDITMILSLTIGAFFVNSSESSEVIQVSTIESVLAKAEKNQEFAPENFFNELTSELCTLSNPELTNGLRWKNSRSKLQSLIRYWSFGILLARIKYGTHPSSVISVKIPMRLNPTELEGGISAPSKVENIDYIWSFKRGFNPGMGIKPDKAWIAELEKISADSSLSLSERARMSVLMASLPAQLEKMKKELQNQITKGELGSLGPFATSFIALNLNTRLAPNEIEFHKKARDLLWSDYLKTRTDRNPKLHWVHLLPYDPKRALALIPTDFIQDADIMLFREKSLEQSGGLPIAELVRQAGSSNPQTAKNAQKILFINIHDTENNSNPLDSGNDLSEIFSILQKMAHSSSSDLQSMAAAWLFYFYVNKLPASWTPEYKELEKKVGNLPRLQAEWVGTIQKNLLQLRSIDRNFLIHSQWTGHFFKFLEEHASPSTMSDENEGVKEEGLKLGAQAKKKIIQLLVDSNDPDLLFAANSSITEDDSGPIQASLPLKIPHAFSKMIRSLKPADYSSVEWVPFIQSVLNILGSPLPPSTEAIEKQKALESARRERNKSLPPSPGGPCGTSLAMADFHQSMERDALTKMSEIVLEGGPYYRSLGARLFKHTQPLIPLLERKNFVPTPAPSSKRSRRR